MKILVCGGAGYIGSHMVRVLLAAGHEPVIFDDFSTGHQWLIEAAFQGSGREPSFIKGSLGDSEALDRCFTGRAFDGVMHFAARSQVAESMLKPGLYYHNNVSGTINLLQAMVRAGVDRLIFSSSAAVYGLAHEMPIRDEAAADPINPYGRTKLMAERIMADFAAVHGLKVAALRYFNVAGADPDGGLGEDHRPETHLIPIIIKSALGRGGPIRVFGRDYPTPDGTCIRDYVHVRDLAVAHLSAFEHLGQWAGGGFEAFNIGTGRGHSNLEVIRSVERVGGRKVDFEFAERRPGDPPVLYADVTKAARVLNWRPAFIDLDDIIATAWQAEIAAPQS
jgi:UDP-glucose-4-epimerase